MKYHVVTAETVEELEGKVTAYIELGWEAAGGIAIKYQPPIWHPYKDLWEDSWTVYFQAMKDPHPRQ